MLGPPDDPKCLPRRPWHTWTSILPPTCVTLAGQVFSPHMFHPKVVPPPTHTHICHPSWAGVSLPYVYPHLAKYSPPTRCDILPGYVYSLPHVSPYTGRYSPPPHMSHYLGRCAPSPSPSPLPLPSPEGARAASSSACAGATNTAGSRARPEALHAEDDTHSGAGVYTQLTVCFFNYFKV